MDIALNNGMTSLGFHQTRGLGKAVLWDRLTGKMSQSFLNFEVEYLTRDMVSSAVLQKHIATRNKQLKNQSLEICVNHRTAYRKG